MISMPRLSSSSASQRKYSSDLIESMRELIISGQSYAQVGTTYDMHRSTVHKLIARYCPIVSESPQLTRNHVTLRKYCEVHNMSYNNLIYHINKKHLPTIRRSNKLFIDINTVITNDKFISDEQIEQIHELAQTNLTAKQIATLLGIHRATVAVYLKE